jgi:hypothetical protein
MENNQMPGGYLVGDSHASGGIKIKTPEGQIEQWIGIKDYENEYEVSNLGNIKSLKRTIIRNNNKRQDVTEKILTQFPDKDGYPCVGIRCNGKPIKAKVHQLVAKNFIQNTYNKKCVNHINGKKTDNRIENLEWVTVAENNIHAIRFLGKSSGKYWLGKKGKDNIKSKKIEQYDLCGNFIKNYDSLSNACIENNFKSTSNITANLKGRTKYAYGYEWKYKQIKTY